MEEKPEDWTYKGSPFLNIGPHVQKEYYEKPIDPSYNGNHPSHQYQIHPLLKEYNSSNKVKDPRSYYVNRYDCPFITNEGYQIVIKEYINKHNILIEFLCSGWQTIARIDDIKKGCVKYPYHPNKCGGYFGEGKYTKNSHKKLYSTWYKMLERTKYYDQSMRNAQYENVSVCFEWYNYQVFAKWADLYLQSLNPNLYNDYQIDKDILQFGFINKVYSPNTCCFVPSAVNLALSSLSIDRKVENLPVGVHQNERTGKYSINISLGSDNKHPYFGEFDFPEDAFQKYKFEKERYIRELADYYYSINAIHKEIKDMLYKIDIQPYKSKGE